MSLSEPFIRRPVGTTLLTIAVALAGTIAYFFLPVSPLPQVDSPTISVSASLPGASPETMASAVATPLERQFGRIAGLNEMTSTSTLGGTSITLQFDLARDINGAARDVQAAINAARGQLPANLPSNPTYRKVNPSDAPVLILSLTSTAYGKPRMYDLASSVLAQKLSQVEGVGQVTVGGGALPGVRVEANPDALNATGLGLDDLRAALAAANADRPKGAIDDGRRTWAVGASDQLLTADEYRPLIVAWRDGAPVRVGDVATVVDSVDDIRATGLVDGKPAISLFVFRQPDANIISTVDAVRALLPQLRAEIPAAIDLTVVLDRTVTIRSSVRDVELALLLSIGLVILVVYVFLRDLRTTLVPAVAVPVSLIGTFGVMWLAGYSIDNLSLMALTIATGFVVDDAIVVAENITRYREAGMPPRQAALEGAREIGFTVLSMSTSLVAVFIPLLLMGGQIGRMFREFSVVLSVAIGVSLLVSLTATPMMCATLLRAKGEERHGRLHRVTEGMFRGLHRFYAWSLAGVLRHPAITLAITLGTVALTVWLYVVVPKGYFPQQDTGRLAGNIRADQNTSTQAMARLLTRFVRTVGEDPAVENVIAFTGGSRGTANAGNMYVALKPLAERRLSADEVIGRLRGKLARIPGATLFLQAVQDLRIGGRASNAQYQFTLQGANIGELSTWSTKLMARLRSVPGIVDLNSDQQDRGLLAGVTIDRPTAARLGISQQAIDNALYDAFGQRQVSTIYRQLNQYHVVMEADPALSQDPSALRLVRIRAGDGSLVPLAAVAAFGPSSTALTVNHQSQFPSITLSFNLLPGLALGDAVAAIDAAERELGLPEAIHGSFSGAAQAYQESAASQPLLIAAALIAVYIVLGMLYESLIHPITILSTLPSAGVGALLALLACRTELSLIAMIGIILLIGIVKKNAIMMIDFALDAERRSGLAPRDAIYQACLLRFRPIMMTTLAAMFGGLPLALGGGVGSELRRPLGIAIVGGLAFSQMLTLYTTPVVYLTLDRLRWWLRGRRHAPPLDPAPPQPA